MHELLLKCLMNSTAIVRIVYFWLLNFWLFLKKIQCKYCNILQKLSLYWEMTFECFWLWTNSVWINPSKNKTEKKLKEWCINSRPLFLVVFCEYYYYLKKKDFWCFKTTRICYLRTKLIKKRCFLQFKWWFWQ